LSKSESIQINSVVAVAAGYIKNYQLLAIPRQRLFFKPEVAFYWRDS